MRELADHPGWRAYVGLLEANMQQMLRGMTQKLETLHDLPGAEWTKGRYAGIDFAIDLLEKAIADIDLNIERLVAVEAEKAKESANGKRSTSREQPESDLGRDPVVVRRSP